MGQTLAGDVWPGDVDKYVADLQDNLRRCHSIARENLKKQAKYRKKYYDSKAKSRKLEINQPVWLHDTTRKIGVCNKLTNNWKGPYLVLKQLDDLTYLIRASPKMVPKVVHIDRLLPYRGSNLPKWFQDFKPKNN